MNRSCHLLPRNIPSSLNSCPIKGTWLEVTWLVKQLETWASIFSSEKWRPSYLLHLHHASVLTGNHRSENRGRETCHAVAFTEPLLNPEHSLMQVGCCIICFGDISRAFTAPCLKAQVTKAAVSKTQQTSISVVIKNQEASLNNSWERHHPVLHYKGAQYTFEAGQWGG